MPSDPAGPAPDPKQIPDAAARAYGRVAGTLESILGPAGVRALMARSLKVVRVEHSPLSSPSQISELVHGPEQLRAWLLAVPEEARLQASSAFFAAFSGLLITLLGESLAGRLLEAGWKGSLEDHVA